MQTIVRATQRLLLPAFLAAVLIPSQISLHAKEYAQDASVDTLSSSSHQKLITPDSINVSPIPVIFHDDTLFFLSQPLGPFSASQRVITVVQKLQEILDRGLTPDSIVVVEMRGYSVIALNDVTIMAVTNEDAEIVAQERTALATQRADQVRVALTTSAATFSTKRMMMNTGFALLFLLVAIAAFWAMRKIFSATYMKIDQWEQSVFRPIHVGSREIFSAASIAAFLTLILKALRFILSLLVLYFFIVYTLSLFPWTKSWDVKPVLGGIFLTILTATAASVVFRLTNVFFTMLIGKIEGWKGNLIKPIKLKTIDVLSEKRIAEILEGGFKLLRLITLAALAYVSITILFSFFEFTRTWAGTLFSYVVDPLWNVLLAFVRFLPNLFFILVIAFVTRYVISFVKLLFAEVSKEHISLPGFHAEWADPTYKIARFLILAFAVIVIFPYLPGSDSPFFQGISVFIGILFSLGSTSAIANVVAGVVLTYMRPFRVGDRVKIADTMGDVVEKTLLVTRVRTIKNVDITIPNAMVLGSHIINFSSSAKERGLVLHTGVTIGYDVPWKKVHELLLSAANKVESLLKEPAPFVLQTSLDDFYVSYELNVYTDQPSVMAKTYSLLHQNIQDAFNEAGVEIMSPHYSAVRDGNQATIPESYLPKSYTPPSFRIFPLGNQPQQSTTKNDE